MEGLHCGDDGHKLGARLKDGAIYLLGFRSRRRGKLVNFDHQGFPTRPKELVHNA